MAYQTCHGLTGRQTLGKLERQPTAYFFLSWTFSHIPIHHTKASGLPCIFNTYTRDNWIWVPYSVCHSHFYDIQPVNSSFNWTAASYQKTNHMVYDFSELKPTKYHSHITTKCETYKLSMHPLKRGTGIRNNRYWVRKLMISSTAYFQFLYGVLFFFFFF